ncbi:MAG: hypothetical protein ACK5NE_06225 [Brachymonas sp.]
MIFHYQKLSVKIGLQSTIDEGHGAYQSDSLHESLPAHEVNLADPRPIFHFRGGAGRLFSTTNHPAHSRVPHASLPLQGDSSPNFGAILVQNACPFRISDRKRTGTNRRPGTHSTGKRLTACTAGKGSHPALCVDWQSSIGRHHAPLRFAGIHMAQMHGQHLKKVLP